MEDKVFELVSKMYSDIMKRFDEVDKKLDAMVDKADLLIHENVFAKLENGLIPQVQVLIDDQTQLKVQLDRIELTLQNMKKS